MNWKDITTWLQKLWDAFLKSLEAEITPVPDPVPGPVPAPTPEKPAHIIIVDLDLIPGIMDAAGFPSSIGAQYYGLACVYANGPGDPFCDDGAGSMIYLNTRRQDLYNWFEAYLTTTEKRFQDNPLATGTIIANDGRDRLGFRLGPPIMARLDAYRGRLEMGDIFPESDY